MNLQNPLIGIAAGAVPIILHLSVTLSRGQPSNLPGRPLQKLTLTHSTDDTWQARHIVYEGE